MLHDLKRELELLVSQQPVRELDPALRLTPGHVEYKGRSLIDFTSWDYLGLSKHERVRRAAHESIEQSGVGTGAPRTLSGTDSAHLAAEHRLALFFGSEASLIFSSRNQAAFSLLTTLCNERDVIIVEEDSLIPAADAAYLMNAGCASFPGRNLSALSAELDRWKGARRRLVVVEALRSNGGDPVSFPPLLELCARFGVDLILDESAAVSAVGLRGAGCSEHIASLGHPEILCKISELAPLSGLPGAAICGSSVLINLILQRSKAFGAETPPTPATMAAVIAAIDLVELQGAARSHLVVLSQRLRSGIASILKRPPEIWESPIVSIPCKSFAEARELCSALLIRGILCEPLQSRGAFSQGGSARFLINCFHSEEQIDVTLAALSDILPRLSR